ncbi:unnamed protein product [Brachionus calyciflorus]|uniref:Translin-associated factor X-interacting protein 1 N-terminal domain-containing protein n=1 Tax=Brachionus calyciflorus TaxID=104777 RepID=A0A813M4C5_9BILA|nr:unnamed protein product [Brachionus calyciflorus]
MSVDIKRYTSGHLNENHLHKPPEIKIRQPWDTSLSKLTPRKSSKSKINILEADSKIGIKILDTKKSINDLKLPKISTGLQLPLSDKELALNILNNFRFKGATKDEKYKNLNKYEEEILKSDDLKINNFLHSNDLAKSLEKKLNHELSSLENNDFSESRKIVMKLNIYTSTFEQLINESEIFGHLLNKIKAEYDDYLFYLMKNPYKIDRSVALNLNELNEYFESIKLKRETNKETIQKLDLEMENIENLLKKYSQMNFNLEARIFSEELFFNEKTLEQAEIRPLDLSKNKEIIKKPTKCEKIEYSKELILKKLDDLNEITSSLKKDYVPIVVVSNLNQTIKDIEIETQKINEQNKFLRSQEQEAENELKEFLLKNDKTEFAKDNVEDLMKIILNFDFLQTNHEDKNTLRNAINTENSSATSFDYYQTKFYDDYFS